MRSRWSSRPERWLTGLVLGLALATVACDRAERSVPALEAAPFEALFERPPPLRTTCAGFAPEAIGGLLRVRLFLAAEVAQAHALEALRSMPSYFHPHGVALELAAPPRRIATGTLIGAGEVEQALRPLAAFLRTLAASAGTASRAREVDVVLLPRIAAPDSPAARYFTELEGFTLSEGSRARDGAFYRALGHVGPLRTTVLLGVEDIRRRRPGRVDLSAAHELGHALGLEHADGDDLMAPRPPRCVPHLTHTQRQTIAQTLGVRE